MDTFVLGRTGPTRRPPTTSARDRGPADTTPRLQSPANPARGLQSAADLTARPDNSAPAGPRLRLVAGHRTQPAAATPALRVEGLGVAYGDRVALRDVSLEMRPGELVSIIGPNGAGKSTLIKAILGVVPAARGDVRVLGRPIHEVHAEVAYVPQREQVDWDFPVTVADVVLMGRTVRLGWLRWPGRRDHALVREALDQVGLLDHAGTPIADLSGGQQQRVFLARALVQQARIMLLDEPLVGVDAASQELILGLLRRLADEGHTIVMATHDLPVAAEISDRLVLLNTRVIADGPPEAVFRPERLAELFGGHVLISGHLDHHVHRAIDPGR